MNNPFVVAALRCAHCGRTQQETSRWFVLSVERGRFRCRPLGRRGPPAVATPSVATLERELMPSDEPACGQQCAQKLFERYMAGETTGRSRG